MTPRDKILNQIGDLLHTGEEHDFSFGKRGMGMQGQLTDEGHITAFQLWPGDGSTLFMSFAQHQLPTPKRAALALVKMLIDHFEEDPDITPFHKEVYAFINSPEGEALMGECV